MFGTSVKVLLIAIMVLMAITPSAVAQSFPTKQIRIVVGFPKGGPSDVAARLLAEKLRLSLGQPIIVENNPGAGGMIAVNELLLQPRDGHTLLLCSYIDSTNTVLYKKTSNAAGAIEPAAYKLDDLAPVSLVQKSYYAFTVSNSLPVGSMAEFIKYAKSRPHQLTYGRVGGGSVTDLLTRQVEKIAGIEMTGLTFDGTGPALQQLVAGRIHFMVGPLFLAVPLFEAKKLKILGMTSPERLATTPTVPTLSEQGLPIVSYGWWGVCAAAGVPKPVIGVLNRHVVAAVASSDFRLKLERKGVLPISSTPGEMERIMIDTATEVEKTTRELGIESSN